MPQKAWGGWNCDFPQHRKLARIKTGNLQGSKCQRKLGAAGIFIYMRLAAVSSSPSLRRSNLRRGFL